MSTNEDEALAAAAADVGIEDATVAPRPETFDWDAFLDGVRPTRRGVRIYPQADLVARMEAIAEQIDDMPDGPEVDALIDDFESLKAQFHNGVWFEVEKRSSEWVEHFRADLAKRLDLDLGDGTDDTKGRDEDVHTALLHQLAEQIVTPAGITYEHVKRLLDTNEGEANKLVVAMTMVNSQIAEKAQVLSVDFSQRRSKNRAQRRSSKR